MTRQSERGLGHIVRKYDGSPSTRLMCDRVINLKDALFTDHMLNSLMHIKPVSAVSNMLRSARAADRCGNRFVPPRCHELELNPDVCVR